MTAKNSYTTIKVTEAEAYSPATLSYLRGDINFEELEKIISKNSDNDSDSDDTDSSLSIKFDNIDDVTLNDLDHIISRRKHKKKKVSTSKHGRGRASGRVNQERRMILRQRKQLKPSLFKIMGRANVAYANGDLETATRLCNEVIKKAPGAAEPFKTLAQIYEDKGDPDKAFELRLLAAHLCNDCDFWKQLVEEAISRKAFDLASTCYSKAIVCDIKNIPLHLERLKFLEKYGLDGKRTIALKRLLTNINPHESDELLDLYVKTYREILDRCTKDGQMQYASKVLRKCFEVLGKKLPETDLLRLLRFNLFFSNHTDTLLILLNRKDVRLVHFDPNKSMEDSEDVIGRNEVYCYRHLANLNAKRFIVPENLTFGLSKALLLSAANVDGYESIKHFVFTFFERFNNVEAANVIVELASCLHKRQEDINETKRLLFYVRSWSNDVEKQANFWQMLADCYKDEGCIEEAMYAYSELLKIDPQNGSARFSLSALQKQSGMVSEAINTLTHDIEILPESVTIGHLRYLIQRCNILYELKKYDDFTTSAFKLLFSGLEKVLRPRDLIASLYSSNRYDRSQAYSCMLSSHSHLINGVHTRLDEPSKDAVYDIYTKLCNLFIKQQDYNAFQRTALMAEILPFLYRKKEWGQQFDFNAFVASVLNGDSETAFRLFKDFVEVNLKCNHAMNLLSLAMNVNPTTAMQKYCLRLQQAHPNNKAIRLMNANFSLASGTYRHALSEYLRLYKENRNEPMYSFYVGIAYLNILSQRYTTHRHWFFAQAIAFLMRYRRLRGECQEVYYNIGRALHQVSIFFGAFYFYNKVLQMPCCVDDPDYDLKRAAAYNLLVLYGDRDVDFLSRELVDKYLVIE